MRNSNSYLRALAVAHNDRLTVDAMVKSAKRLVRAGVVSKDAAANELRTAGAFEAEISEVLAV